MDGSQPTAHPGWYTGPDHSGQMRYWDGQAWGPPGAGAEAPRVAAPQDLRQLATLTSWAIGAVAVLEVISALASVAVDSFGDLGVLLAVDAVGGVAFVLAIGVFITWFHRAYRNLPRLGPVRPRHGSGWAIGTWFVPVLNLVRPYGMTWELWTAGDPTQHERFGSRAYRREQGKLIPAWWACWLVTIAASFELTVNDATSRLLPQWVGLPFTVAGAVLAVLVVRRVTERQTSRPGVEVVPT